MFEGSLVESRGLVASKTQRWSALGSLGIQCAVAATLIAIPMLRPEMLPVNMAAPKITVPQMRPVQVVQRVTQSATNAADGVRLPAIPTLIERTSGSIVRDPIRVDGPSLPAGVGTLSMGDASSLAPLAAFGTGEPRPAAVAASRPMRISSGVSSGMLLSPIRPAYPPIAKMAGVQGTVVIEAVISKSGQVESLRVVSGPELLRNAATDAVRAARYMPYQLNGEPVEVQTTITVVFRLG